EDFCPVLRRCGGGVEIPVEIGLLERGQRGLQYSQSAGFAESAPAAWREEPMVARVPIFFHGVQPLFRFGLVVLHAAVDEQEVTSPREHPGGFADEGLRPAEVMGRHAAG